MATVLVVTNDRQDSRGVATALSRCGHVVVVEHDENGAHRVLTTRHVDVLIADETLPSIHGATLIDAARSALQRPGLPAIVLAPDSTERPPRAWGRTRRVAVVPPSAAHVTLALATLAAD